MLFTKEDPIMRHDWKEAVERNPKGYVELNNGKEALHGPVESVKIDDMDFVAINVKWAAKIKLGEMGLPSGEWEAVSSTPMVIALFPNFAVPFEFEDTPEKGPRVRFGLNILYLDEVEGLDPSKVKGLYPTTT
jgi:hypothetical protein